jgi:hypothetical protein
MRRRDFIKVIVGSAAGWPLAARPAVPACSATFRAGNDKASPIAVTAGISLALNRARILSAFRLLLLTE